ncbi:MAG: hypothetical protein Q8R28_12515 [Dehalococcoidia bacterium]|nr:hypothetical protein [Dehalococcoidia bacterium]
MESLSRKLAIVGVGDTECGRATGKSCLRLAAESAKNAIEDAGLTKEDIDGVLTSTPISEPHHMFSHFFIEYMGIRTKYNCGTGVGGATPHGNVMQAAALIAAGVCEVVLIADGDRRATQFRGDKAIAMGSHAEFVEEFETPFGPFGAGSYAWIAQRHMYEYGTTSEQLAAITVAARKHGALQPNSTLRSPVTIQDVLDSPMIASPLHLLDCCLVSDSAGAMIVTSAGRARDLRKPPVYLMGMGQANQGYYLSQAPSITSFPIKVSGQRAFQMAGVEPKDIDLAEIYDSFTITALVAIEDLGFCKKGEGGPFVEGGRIELGGQLPVNTHGGQLSHNGGHSHFIIEAVRQLRGEAGERQVKDARLALSQGTAGVGSASFTLVLGK